MENLIFILKAISGNGWNASIKSILPSKNRLEYSTLLGDVGLFYIRDIPFFKNKGIFYQKINQLNLDENEKIKLTKLLEEKIDELLKIEKIKAYTPIFILTAIGFAIVIGFLIENASNQRNVKFNQLEEINESIKKREQDYKNLGIGLEHIKKELKKCSPT